MTEHVDSIPEYITSIGFWLDRWTALSLIPVTEWTSSTPHLGHYHVGSKLGGTASHDIPEAHAIASYLRHSSLQNRSSLPVCLASESNVLCHGLSGAGSELVRSWYVCQSLDAAPRYKERYQYCRTWSAVAACWTFSPYLSWWYPSWNFLSATCSS